MPPQDLTTPYPAYRPYRALVQEVTALSPHFVRISFTAPDFEHFAAHAKDQRIKLVFPLDEHTFTELGVDDEAARMAGSWYDTWRALDTPRQSPFRTYTVRAVDQAERRVDVDFVVHTEGGVPVGPGATWLSTAAPGQDIIIVGPDARSADSHVGLDWRPGNATQMLLLGDETAAPAIAGILETLPPEHHATAFIEVPTHDDAVPVTTTPNTRLEYLARGAAPVGSLLTPALTQWIAANPATMAEATVAKPQPLTDVDVNTETLWDSPETQHDGGFYAWIAGESAVIKHLRRTLVTHHGVDRKRVAFMGYWRMGQAERTG